MSAELWLGLLAILVSAPPAYYAIYQGIKKDRAAQSERIELRLLEARAEGRADGVQAAELEQLRQRVDQLGGGTDEPR
ncbi:MAG: hypothetical protein ABI047_03150 [Jatrophihabitantaceae bacterium]